MLVSSLLIHQEAFDVLSIPLFNHALIDTRIWKVTPDANHKAKSAYCICVDLLHLSINAQVVVPYQNIWSLKIPSRVHSFLWRLSQQCLLTCQNLTTRGIPCDDSCVICESLTESHMHLFFACAKTKECWESIGLGTMIR